MKKLSLIITIFALIFTSCKFDEGFEELNVDPTASSNLDVNPKFAYLFLKTAGDEYEISFTEILCAGQLVQQVIDNDFPQASIYSVREDLNHAYWDTAYETTIKTNVDIIDQLEKDGNTGTEMGIARIWKVFLFHKLVDTYGETPYFNAGGGYQDSNFRPEYDTVEEIYADMLSELEGGLGQIGSSSTLGSADIVFDGDTAKWKKFGYSLMLRLAMRIKNVDASTSSSFVAKAIAGGVMSSIADNALMIHTDGPADLNRNAWGVYAPRYANARIGKTFYDWMASRSDPRLNIISDPNGPAAGNPYGYTLDDLAIAGLSTADFATVNPAITRNDSPRMFLTYAQTALMLAEHHAASGDHATAETHYNDGVTAAINQWASFDGSLAVSSADISAYLALAANAYDSTKALEQIGDQFWAASFFDFFESFANWRRTGFPNLIPFGGNPAHPQNVTNGTIPRRLILNPVEASSNTENYNSMINSQGPNNLTTKVWWDN